MEKETPRPTELTLLPDVVAAGLNQRAAHQEAGRAYEDGQASTWRAIDTLQQQVFDEHERQVVDPHRFAWRETLDFLKTMPFTRAWANQTTTGIWLQLRWDFLQPQLHDAGTGHAVPLRSVFDVSVYRNTAPETLRTLFRDIIGQKEDAGQLAVRQAVRAIGVDTPFLPRRPAQDSWRPAFTEAFIDKASNIKAAVWTMDGNGQLDEVVPGTAVGISQKDLRRADAITWNTWYRHAGHVQTTLQEDTKESFLKAVGKGHGIERAALEDLTPVMITDFMRIKVQWDHGYGLHWAVDDADTMRAIVDLARQSAPYQPQIA